MARRRTQDDGCGIAHASDLLGQRWALLVVRELLLGPKRFTDLRAGILHRRKLVPPAAAQVYELTGWGRDLEPAVLGLGWWASRSPGFPLGAPMGPDSLVLALKTTFQPEKADRLDATYELWLGEIPYSIRVNGGFDAQRGEAGDPDATLRSDPDTLAGIVFGGRPLGRAIDSGEVEVGGSRRAVNALFRALG